MGVTQVYSKRFMAEAGASGTPYTAGPPSGFKWVIVDISTRAGAAGVALELELDGIYVIVVNTDGPTGAVLFGGHWSGRQVVEAGETFTAAVSSACDFTISGYELSLP